MSSIRIASIVFCLLVCSIVMLDLALFGEQSDSGIEKWSKILLAEKFELPRAEPSFEFKLNQEIEVAISKAIQYKAPIYVELICPKIKEDYTLAKMLNENSTVRRFLSYFTKCRIEDLNKLHENMFQIPKCQDLDKMWWVWLISAEGHVYSTFGGYEQKGTNDSVSLKGLENTLERVLLHHYNPEAEKWNVVRKYKKRTSGFKGIRDLETFTSWNKLFSIRPQACIRCHNAVGIFAHEKIQNNTFSKRDDYFYWPFPQTIGINIDENHGLKVGSVIVDSPAKSAGLVPGDIIGAAEGLRLFSSSDFRSILNELPNKKTKLELMIIRDGKVVPVNIQLGDDWKRSDISWRKGLRYIAAGASTGMGSVKVADDDVRKKLRIKDDSMALIPSFGRNPARYAAYSAGLREEHVIVAVNKESPDIRTGGEFEQWFRMNFEKSEKITLSVIDQNTKKKQKIKYDAP